MKPYSGHELTKKLILLANIKFKGGRAGVTGGLRAQFFKSSERVGFFKNVDDISAYLMDQGGRCFDGR